MGFRRLGTNAGSAVPPLIKIYAPPTFPIPRARRRSWRWMTWARAAFQLLARGLESRDTAVREMIAGVLGRIQAPASAVVPLLGNCLGDGSATVRSIAAAGLARFGTAASSATPALVKARQDPDAHKHERGGIRVGTDQPGGGREMRRVLRQTSFNRNFKMYPDGS